MANKDIQVHILCPLPLSSFVAELDWRPRAFSRFLVNEMLRLSEQTLEEENVALRIQTLEETVDVLRTQLEESETKRQRAEAKCERQKVRVRKLELEVDTQRPSRLEMILLRRERAEFEDERAEAHREIAAARKKITKAQKTITTNLKRTVHALQVEANRYENAPRPRHPHPRLRDRRTPSPPSATLPSASPHRKVTSTPAPHPPPQSSEHPPIRTRKVATTRPLPPPTHPPHLSATGKFRALTHSPTRMRLHPAAFPRSDVHPLTPSRPNPETADAHTTRIPNQRVLRRKLPKALAANEL
ncbi:hypothetical protein C8J57DRAFT_1511664 [Mycena rebaudengoi]|nr:hypothetical protein C8J57DRAFT_1511664 [Mycena rebaudengoi]